jgi:hypothetical protein
MDTPTVRIINKHNRRGLILAPGCIALPRTPEDNILQLRKTVEKTLTITD